MKWQYSLYQGKGILELKSLVLGVKINQDSCWEPRMPKGFTKYF